MSSLAPNERGRCPHCGVVVMFTGFGSQAPKYLFRTIRQEVELSAASCPSCRLPIVQLSVTEILPGADVRLIAHNRLIWPAGRNYNLPPQVPEHIRRDFLEAAAVLPISPNASAALSRRCLQAMLREAGGATSHRLSSQIKEVSEKLPSEIAAELDYVREVGNLAAHPEKEEGSGQLLNAAPGEAEVNLEVLFTLIDELYEKPLRRQERRRALNRRLLAAGRTPIGNEDDMPDSGDENGDVRQD